MDCTVLNALVWVGGVRWSGIVPFPAWVISECLWKKICRWKASVCSLAVKFCGSFLAMHIIFFPNLWYYYSIYTLFYCTGGFQMNSSLLYPADSCSNLKECLNKICTLPCHLSSVLNLFLLLSWSITRLCPIVRANNTPALLVTLSSMIRSRAKSQLTGKNDNTKKYHQERYP